MMPPALRTALTWAWWVIMPPFAVLVVRLDAERACAAPYELLPTATAIPMLAWLLASLYVAAHALLFAGWLATSFCADALVPAPSAVGRIWGRQRWMVVVTAAIFVLEYWPVPAWQALGRVLGCAP